MFKLAAPYYDAFEQEAGNLLAKYIKSRYPSDYLGPINVYEGGCGTGLTTKVLLDIDPRVRVFAIDNEPVLLDQARESFKEYGERVNFIESDLLEAIENLNELDIFVSVFTIHNMLPEYRENLFGKIGEKMKSGGLLINGDKIAQNDLEAHKKDLDAQLEALKIFTQKGQPELAEQWTKHYLEDDKIKMTESDQINLLEKSGFINISLSFRHLTDAIVIAEKR